MTIDLEVVMPVLKQSDVPEKALTSKIDEARKLIQSHAARDSTFRYDLGVIARDIKSDSKKYGEQAVERLAVELSYDASMLYEYARVDCVWNKASGAEVQVWAQAGTTLAHRLATPDADYVPPPWLADAIRGTVASEAP